MEMKKLASAIAYDNVMTKQAAAPAWLSKVWNKMGPSLRRAIGSKWALPAIGGGTGLAVAAPGAAQQFREGNVGGAITRLGTGAAVGTGAGYLGRKLGRTYIDRIPAGMGRGSTSGLELHDPAWKKIFDQTGRAAANQQTARAAGNYFGSM